MPSLYPYRMTDTAGRSTTGVIGALGLAEPGEESDVLPHEQTLPKPKSDRLDLLRATRANLSPIWGLSMAAGRDGHLRPDRRRAGGRRLRRRRACATSSGCSSDPDAIAAVGDAVAAAPVVLADGHHRYETARTYQAECRARQRRTGRGRTTWCMALVVELAEDQLTVGAIHRTVSGLPEGSTSSARSGQWFDVVRAGAADDRTLGALADSNSLALVTGGDGLPAPPPRRDQRGGGQRPRLQPRRHGALRPPAARGHAPPQRGRGHGGARDGEGQAAFLLRPVTVKQIDEWANERRRMPPKTTYFSPKPRTGMVFRSLDLP